MPFELRVPTPDEFAAFSLPTWRAFSMPDPSEEGIEDNKFLWEPDRSIGAIEDGEWIGGAGAYTFDLTLPGGSTLPAAGVTMVGVSPTHRRRGVLNQLMERQLADVVDLGEPLAILTASESLIYGRFGYGLAVSHAVMEIDSTRSAFRAGAEPAPPGRLRLLAKPDAAGPLQAAYERCRLIRAGAITRRPEYWELHLRDRERWRDGASALYVAIHEDADGQPDGLVTWRQKESWTDAGLPRATVLVNDLCATTAEIEAVLWRLVLDVDLSTRVVAEKRPVDDPIKWRLLEPRRAQTNVVSDWLWLRVLDVPAALEGRGYQVSGQLVVEVEDRFRPSTSGRYLLDTDTKESSCSRTDAKPDLAMQIDDLGAIYLGGVAPSTLAAAGRIQARSAEVLARADDLFATSPAPFCMTGF
ncbi:MAG: GNAT family N-acetyltransferase [Acidimicrobiia bacterium]|nr:GNAT family N-acetyltransferase [Acidimicrobiia bacterium]